MDKPQLDVRYAPPQVNVDDVDTALEGLQLASRTQRLLAVMLDGISQLGALWLVSVLTSYNPWSAQGRDMWSINLTGMLAGVVIFLILNGYLLVTRGQTIGKVLLKLRIARASGEPASAARLAIRYGAGFASGIVVAFIWIYSLLDCILIFRKSRRCLHDEIADTVVFKI